MNTKLTRGLALPGILLAMWSAGARAQDQPPPAVPVERTSLPGGGTDQPIVKCILGDDFENGTVGGWSSTHANNFSVHHPGSSSNSCLYAHDDQGGSTINAPPGYFGDWSHKLSAAGCSCGEFCYDVNLLNNGSHVNPLSSTFVLYGLSGAYAQFQSTLTFVAGSGWHHFCAPVRLTGGAPPAGTDGIWVLHPSTASWDNIVQNVTKVTFPVDWANGEQVEEVEYDNVCLRCKVVDVKPEFTATKVCAGQATQLTSTSTNATSWDWYTGGQIFSHQPNPTYTFPAPGTYPVKLCVASSCGGAPVCVTHNVTVVGPAPFTITGPVYASSGSAVYCATPPQTSPPASYHWSVPLPATATPVSGNPSCATVSWNGLNGGVVTATATTAGPPQCTRGAELPVKPVADPERDCCSGTTLAVTGVQLTQLASPPGAYQLHASVSASPGLFTQVSAEVLSTIATYPAGSSCAQGGPVESHVLGAPPLGPLAATLPVAGSHEVWWQGPPTALSSTPATLNLQLPPFGGDCPIAKLTVCMKYSFTSMCCRTCQLIECYDVLPPPCPGCS